jgi:hypothetical protein
VIGALLSVESRTKNELTVQGISASPGIAYGQIFVYIQSDVEVPSYLVDGEKRLDEVARFDRALVATRQQITKIKNEVEKNIGPEEALIFDAHLMVLEDQALIGETIREFEATGRNIETCFNQASGRYIQAFSEIDDAYLRERAGDIRDVAQRVLQNLLGQAENALSRLAEAEPRARPADDEGSLGHVLRPAREDGLDLAEEDAVLRLDERLEAGPAETVHGDGGRLLRHARAQADVAGQVDRVGGGLEDVPDDHVADFGRFEARPAERFL